MCTGTATGYQGQGVPVCLPCHGRAAPPTTVQLQPPDRSRASHICDHPAQHPSQVPGGEDSTRPGGDPKPAGLWKGAQHTRAEKCSSPS